MGRDLQAPTCRSCRTQFGLDIDGDANQCLAALALRVAELTARRQQAQCWKHLPQIEVMPFCTPCTPFSSEAVALGLVTRRSQRCKSLKRSR